MSEALIGTLIGGGITLLGTVLTQIFIFHKERVVRRYELVHDLIPKRLGAHEKISVVVAKFAPHKIFHELITSDGAEKFLIALLYKFTDISFETQIWAHSEVSRSFSDLIEVIREHKWACTSKPSSVTWKFIDDFSESFNKVAKVLREKINRYSGSNAVDKLLHFFDDKSPVVQEKVKKDKPDDMPSNPTNN